MFGFWYGKYWILTGFVKIFFIFMNQDFWSIKYNIWKNLIIFWTLTMKRLKIYFQVFKIPIKPEKKCQFIAVIRKLTMNLKNWHQLETLHAIRDRDHYFQWNFWVYNTYKYTQMYIDEWFHHCTYQLCKTCSIQRIQHMESWVHIHSTNTNKYSACVRVTWTEMNTIIQKKKIIKTQLNCLNMWMPWLCWYSMYLCVHVCAKCFAQKLIWVYDEYI